MFRKILVPIDGTAASMRALSAAIELAEKLNATLVVMTVIDETHGWASVPAAGITYALEEESKALEHYLTTLVDHALDITPESVPVMKVITTGNPAQQILKQLKAGGYDLIVLGSRGLGTVGGAIMGSVSRHVLQGGGVPTLVVREEPGDEPWLAPKPEESPAT